MSATTSKLPPPPSKTRRKLSASSWHSSSLRRCLPSSGKVDAKHSRHCHRPSTQTDWCARSSVLRTLAARAGRPAASSSLDALGHPYAKGQDAGRVQDDRHDVLGLLVNSSAKPVMGAASATTWQDRPPFPEVVAPGVPLGLHTNGSILDEMTINPAEHSQCSGYRGPWAGQRGRWTAAISPQAAWSSRPPPPCSPA